MSKRMLLPVLALLLLVLLSLFPVNSSISTAKTQTSSSNSSLPSVVSREYPYIAPHLVENATHYIYVTDWGNYTFSKALPYVCRYTFRNGKTMVSFSTFWINTSSMLIPLNPTVLTANNTYFKVQVDAYKLTTKMVTIIQEWNFDRTDKPKISVTLTKTANWNLGNFNIFWIVAGYQYVKQNETSTINCNQTITYWKKAAKAEMGESANINDWREWLVVDWGDEGLADVWLGQFNIFGYSLAVVKVDFTVNDGQLDPSLVGTSSSSTATSYPFQRKSFYANGRFWVFYSDGTNMVYRTSTDGSTWSSATTVRAASSGYTFSIWFDGTYLHYAYASASAIYYRRGTPNADGTITWSAAEQTAASNAYYPFVSVDANGYVWIGYYYYTIGASYPYVIRSGNNDGTWGTTPSGFPYQLSTISASQMWAVTILPLTSGKMLALYTYDSGHAISARAWNGTAWGTEASTTSTGTYADLSAVAQGDDVHLTFCTTGYNILYTKYSYASNSFSAETTLVSGSANAIAPVISINPATNDLYVFWAGYPTANHIYYRKYNASTGTWETAVDWITEPETLTGDRHTSFYQSYGGYIGLLYMTKTASPYNIKFDALGLTPPPPPPGIVGVTTQSRAVGGWYSHQRNSFYANGRFWAFWGDGNGMVYATSTNGVNWTAPTTVKTGGLSVDGSYFSIWFDGTWLYYAYSPMQSGCAIYFRRGIPNSDGTITWSADEQIAVPQTAGVEPLVPFVGVDSGGYPYIGYYTETDIINRVTKSSTNDGTWTTASGFPYQLSTTSGRAVSVLPLTGGKMIAIYAIDTIRVRVWNGSAWGTEASTTSTCLEWLYSAVAQGDDVHLVFLKSTGYDIIYTKYSYASNSFSPETTLVSGAPYRSAPVLSINPATNDLYVFWAGYPTANHIYYRKYTAATGLWENPVDWIDESSSGLTGNDQLRSFYQSYGGYIGLLYMTKTASPYNLKFASLSVPINSAPIVGDVKVPAVVYANQYFTVNVTVNDPDGVKDFQNCTLDFPGSKIRMRWLNVTNAFEKILDPENCALLKSQESFKTNLNTTAHTLTFKMKILWNYTLTGTVTFNITVYDKLGWNGTKQATLKFSKYPIWLPAYNTNVNFTETLHAENVICQDDKITLKNASLGSEPEKSDVTITVENANLTVTQLLHDRKFTAELNGKTGTVAHLALSFSFYKWMPHTITIAGIPITTPYATKTEFDSYNGNCWYYDTTTNTIHIKAMLHSPTSIYIDWNPAPAPAPAPTPTPTPTPTPQPTITPPTPTIPTWTPILIITLIIIALLLIRKRR